jgi:hypothetical protein
MTKKTPNNLRALRKSRNLTLKQVAALTGISLSGVQKHETGERDMDTEVLGLYEKLYKVSKNQIAPSAFDKMVEPSTPRLVISEHETSANKKSGYVSLYELDTIGGTTTDVSLHKYKHLEPPYPIPLANLNEASFSDPKNLYIIRVFGDNMEPTLSDGCRVVVDAGITKFNKSGIYVLWDGTGLSIKRMQSLSNGKIQLLSDNKNYPLESVSLQNITIKGRVILIVSKSV